MRTLIRGLRDLLVSIVALAFFVYVGLSMLPSWLRWILFCGVVLAVVLRALRWWERRAGGLGAKVRTLDPAEPGGTVYRISTPGEPDYIGSSGDLPRWAERMTEHYMDNRIPIRPGTRIEVEFLPTRAAAYDVEAVAIDADLADGRPLLNRRREGRRA